MMDYLIALAPSIGLGVVFYIIMRAFLRADRRERAYDAKVRAEIAEQLRKEAEEEENSDSSA